MALLPANPADRNKVAIGFLAVVVAFAYWNWVYEPKRAELDTVRQHVESLDAANQSAKKELAKGNVNELRAQADTYKANLETMRQLVPTGNEVPALLDQISTAARRVNLDIGSVEPLPVIVGNDFDTYRYRMAIGGDYHTIARFLSNVGSLPRIMAPVNLSLGTIATPPSAKNRQRANTQMLRATFEVQTYVAKAGATTTDQGLAQ